MDWEKIRKREIRANFKPRPNEAYFLQLDNMNEVLLGGSAPSSRGSTGSSGSSLPGKKHSVRDKLVAGIAEEDQKLFSKWDWVPSSPTW